MTRQRSPSYPSIDLGEAIVKAKEIFDKNRRNAIDRKAVGSDLGYKGITGRSQSILAALIQFGLIEKAEKGKVRVTQRAVDATYGVDDSTKAQALVEAFRLPTLYKNIEDRFSDGMPSENALRSYLIQEEFSNAAITPALQCYIKSLEYVKRYTGFEQGEGTEVSSREAPEKAENIRTFEKQTTESTSIRPSDSFHTVKNTGPDLVIREGERTVFSEEVSKQQYIKLIALGEIDEEQLEALESFVVRQRKRLEKRVEKKASPTIDDLFE